ncbi:hypothetical protein [Streptomyces hydrogenans]|uniref:Uncharacterized protein n=1 Tax=Streptomyces hydrogenans TaxID=1873719 RepID=A0ABQ3PHC6_9ACTN|nr:hypothetical protein [Streptomyces hydrogenans]GHG19676.1 hypothetical protein GCM10018784_36090 [Streptomyces hydrogenans]GHI20387.1 hypothetical protein Shyd_17580 [Streptomyces hydrogenans]GHI22794.1 hypothetical protein Shyd_41650 [Streptomyces hydrogenans]GHI22802.1 hypothetical protein Shyd_41730 [Streptomyces hydrogenans]GHI23391.1 hypothetical protein Shyd_47620 [Streptomyces hydrogenans]
MQAHRPATFAAVLGLTRAASAAGDFWVQSDFCARVKGASDDHPVTYEDPATGDKTTHGTADGRKACLEHCLTYTATQAIVAGLGARALGIRIHPAAAAAALAISFGTHYVADRRVPGEGLLEKLATRTGKGGFYKLADFGMNGAFHLDSAWHHGWETVAALVATTGAKSR